MGALGVNKDYSKTVNDVIDAAKGLVPGVTVEIQCGFIIKTDHVWCSGEAAPAKELSYDIKAIGSVKAQAKVAGGGGDILAQVVLDVADDYVECDCPEAGKKTLYYVAGLKEAEVTSSSSAQSVAAAEMPAPAGVIC